MKSTSARFASFRVLSFGSLALALGAAFAVACSSSDATAPAPSTDSDASTDDGGSGGGAVVGNDAGGGSIGESEPDSAAGDDGSTGGDDGGPVTCPAINGSYSLMVPAAGSSSECPSDTDTCTFATDTTTCKFVGSCAQSGQTFDTTIDSTGKISYSESFDAGSSFGTIMGDCTLQFAADKQSLAGSCVFGGFVTCNATGAYVSDGGVILDASTD